MFKPKFTLLSAFVMIILTSAISVAMMKTRGDGLEFQMGLPFAWYHWADFKHASPFNPIALIADVVLWVPFVIGFGMLVDRFLKS